MIGFLVFIVTMWAIGSGVTRNIRQEQAEEFFRKNGIKVAKYRYNFLLTVISGLGFVAALIGLVMMSAGSIGKAGLILGGLAVSVLTCLPAIRDANENVRALKKEGKDDDGLLSPLKVWLNITLVGVGKVMHALLICTLIGIPLYNMLRQVQWGMENMIQQIELRQEAEALRQKEGM